MLLLTELVCLMYKKLEVLELHKVTLVFFLWFKVCYFDVALVLRRCPEDAVSTGTSTYHTCPSEVGGSIHSGFYSLGSFRRFHINRDFEANPPPMCKDAQENNSCSHDYSIFHFTLYS